MRGVVVGLVCARGRISFVTVADAQGRARRCFDVFPTWGVGAIGGRALAFCRLFHAARVSFCRPPRGRCMVVPMRVFSVESADGGHMAWSVCGAYDGMVSSASLAGSTGGGSSHGALK